MAKVEHFFPLSAFYPFCTCSKYQWTCGKRKIMLKHTTVTNMQYMYKSKSLYLKRITFSFALVFSLQSV